jgi:peptidoglycan/LPS O-acetylase OafA/YrhL
VSRLSQIMESRVVREIKIKPEAAGKPPWHHGIYLTDMLAADRNSFAIIRMAMALAVLVSHSYWFASGTTGAQPLVRWTGHSLGEHAVQVFFLLSGILVAQSLHRSGSIIDYLCARGMRIFPALGVCVLLTAFVLGPIVTNIGLGQYLADSRVAAYIVKTLTLSTGSAPLPGVFTAVPLANLVNVSLWTLKFEVLCYMALAVLGVAGLMNERYRAWSAVGLAVFVGLVFLRQPNASIPYTAIDNIRYLMLFFFTGVLAFQCRQWLFVHGLLVLPLAAIFVASIGTRFIEISSAAFLGYTMLWVSTFSFGGLRAFTNKNDYSYGTYIYAGPIQQMIVHYLPGFAPWVVTGFAVGMAVPLAVYSWELIERPALALRRPMREWFLALKGRFESAAAAMTQRKAIASIEPEPAVAFAEAFAAAGRAATHPVGTEIAAVNQELTTPPRRQRRQALVTTAPAPTTGPLQPQPQLPSRRRRPALDLKPVKVSPEVALMLHSKAFTEAAAKSRSSRAQAAAIYATGFDASATAHANPQRTPYARNWLMSLGWLAASTPVTEAQSQGTVGLDDLAGKRNRPQGPAVGNRDSAADGAFATARRLEVTAPRAPSPLLAEAAQEAAAPRLTLRTWLSSLTASRKPEPAKPEPVAEIPADRLAQALRPRAQTRPKWTVPANDKSRDAGPDPLPV